MCHRSVQEGRLFGSQGAQVKLSRFLEAKMDYLWFSVGKTWEYLNGYKSNDTCTRQMAYGYDHQESDAFSANEWGILRKP